MAKKRESRLQAKIHRHIKREFNWWGFKVWGGPFQPAGIPDLLGCVAGLFFAIEVKMPKGKVSEIQEDTIKKIKRVGGHATVVTSPEEADRFIRRVLREEGRLLEGSKAAPKASSRVRIESTREILFRKRPFIQAKIGKNLHRRGRHRKTATKKDARYRPSHK